MSGVSLDKAVSNLVHDAALQMARAVVQTVGGRLDCIEWFKEQLLVNQNLRDMMITIVGGGLVIGVLEQHIEERKKENESRIISFK